MDTLSIGIIIVLLVYTAIGVLDQISIQIGPYTPLFAAAFTGFVMGDLTTGLLVGATLQLMTLGVATYGGATVPDFLSGAIMGTAYAILSGKGVEYGIGIAIPIGLCSHKWIFWVVWLIYSGKSEQPNLLKSAMLVVWK